MELKNYLSLVTGATVADILSTTTSIKKNYGGVTGVEGNPFVADYLNNGDFTGYLAGVSFMGAWIGLGYIADKLIENYLENKNPEDKTKFENFVEDHKNILTKTACISFTTTHLIGALSWYYPKIGYPLCELSNLLYNLI